MLAICETGKQVEWVYNHPELYQRISHLFVSAPDAAWACERLKIPCLSIEDFQPDVFELTHKLLKHQIEWSHYIDNQLQQSVEEFRRQKFRPTRAFLFNLQESWHLLLFRALMLEAVSEKYHPKEILYFSNTPPQLFNKELKIQTSALTTVICPWAKHYGIRENTVSELNEGYSSKKNDDSVSGFNRIRKKLGLVNLKQRPLIFLEKLMNSKKNNGKDPLVALIPHYDITKSLRDELVKRGLRWIELNKLIGDNHRSSHADQKLKNNLAKAWEQLSDSENFCLPSFGIRWTLRPILIEMMKTYWFETIPALWRSYNGSINKLSKFRPVAILAGIMHHIPQVALIMASHFKKIMVIMYQHGSLFGEIDSPAVFPIQDRYWADFMLVYGNGQKEYIENLFSYDARHAEPVAAGSVRLDDVRNRCNQEHINKIKSRIKGAIADAPLVLYVPGALLNNQFHFSNVRSMDLEYFRLRLEVSRLFSRYRKINFLYKPFISMGKDPTFEMLKQVCPNIIIVRNIPLAELQYAMDLIIHEFPCTGMLEGLLTDKPMIVYTDPTHQKYTPRSFDMLSKRVKLAKTTGEMIELIESCLTNDLRGRKVESNNEFLERFGTFLNDGHSAKRAATEIERIIRQNTGG